MDTPEARSSRYQDTREESGGGGVAVTDHGMVAAFVSRLACTVGSESKRVIESASSGWLEPNITCGFRTTYHRVHSATKHARDGPDTHRHKAARHFKTDGRRGWQQTI